MINQAIDALSAAWVWLHATVFETLVQPLVVQLGMLSWLEQAFDATEILLIGAVEILVLAVTFRVLERWRPVETWRDRAPIRVDILYTFLVRLGVLPLGIFFLLLPVIDGLNGWLRLQGFIPPKPEDFFPSLAANPLASFFVYLVILDFVGYWVHRLQHRWPRWWALHALHHSQREMTFWADDRNHVLDMVFVAAVFALVALLIGVPPGQFVAVVVVTRVLESLAHANVRLSFGRWFGDWVLVSPRFHRVHHAIGVGHEGEAQGHNFAVLFPIWDQLFFTASRETEYPQTGIRDQLDGRDYGRGFWRQQWLGVQRFVRGQ